MATTTNSNPNVTSESLSEPIDPLATPVQVTAAPTIDGAPARLATTPADAASTTDPAVGAAEDLGVGIDGEQTVWEGSYCARNFMGRIVWRLLLTAGLVALAVGTWIYGNEELLPMTVIVGLVTIAVWTQLIYRMLQMCYGRSYRLTNRRLFVDSGLWQRRQDQMELVRVKDVFLRQTFLERWRGIGTVVVVPAESQLPTFFLVGVNCPQNVMDRSGTMPGVSGSRGTPERPGPIQDEVGLHLPSTTTTGGGGGLIREPPPVVVVFIG
ncbi:MAG: PH domain-containing protein [Isosphaeraceae bacterium]